MAEYCFKLIKKDRGDKSAAVDMVAEYYEVTISLRINDITICVASDGGMCVLWMSLNAICPSRP